MSIQRAISIVFERRPDLRFYIHQILHFLFVSDLVTIVKRLGEFVGWKVLVIRCYSGTSAEWKAGLLQMPILFHLEAGIRLLTRSYLKFRSFIIILRILFPYMLICSISDEKSSLTIYRKNKHINNLQLATRL